MKKYTLILMLASFLFACNRPMKLLDKGKPEKALDVSMKRLKSGKVKEDHLYVFEKSFMLATQADAQWVDETRRYGEPALWVKIYKRALAIEDRQQKADKVLTRLNAKGYYPDLEFYAANALIEEARDNVARYYYSKAQAFIPAAQNDDRQAARKAYRWLTEVQRYRPNYKDAKSLASEMFDIGTTHVLVNPREDGIHSIQAQRLFSVFFRNESFPQRLDWEVLHIDYPAYETIDYRLDLEFDELYVSWDREEIVNSCSNTVSIEDGYEELEVWSEKDSAYVIERRPIYVDVSVTVNNFAQRKHADLSLQANLIDLKDNQIINYFSVARTEDWLNEYSQVYGDRRALTTACTVWDGCRRPFPSDYELLRAAAEGLNRQFYQVVEDEIN